MKYTNWLFILKQIKVLKNPLELLTSKAYICTLFF